MIKFIKYENPLDAMDEIIIQHHSDYLIKGILVVEPKEFHSWFEERYFASLIDVITSGIYTRKEILKQVEESIKKVMSKI